MAPICAELLQHTDPLCPWEATDMERGFWDQVSWSVPGTHQTAPWRHHGGLVEVQPIEALPRAGK